MIKNLSLIVVVIRWSVASVDKVSYMCEKSIDKILFMCQIVVYVSVDEMSSPGTWVEKVRNP